MKNHLRLMGVTAHPDDETLGLGPVLARYGAEGVRLLWFAPHAVSTAGQRQKKIIRAWTDWGESAKQNYRAAAQVLGVTQVHFLNYIDGDLDKANPAQVIAQVASHLRRFKPQVVITFDPFGAYGHPDHIAICQFTSSAIVAAANHGEPLADGTGEIAPHVVSRLYYMADTAEMLDPFEKVSGDIGIEVNGTRRKNIRWPQWSISAVIERARPMGDSLASDAVPRHPETRVPVFTNASPEYS